MDYFFIFMFKKWKKIILHVETWIQMLARGARSSSLMSLKGWLKWINTMNAISETSITSNRTANRIAALRLTLLSESPTLSTPCLQKMEKQNKNKSLPKVTNFKKSRFHQLPRQRWSVTLNLIEINRP